MERTPKGIYTPEFRAEAVKLVETTGMSVARAAKQLSMPRAAWITGYARHGKASWRRLARDNGYQANWNLSWHAPARNWLT
jgi:transposase-like protein